MITNLELIELVAPHSISFTSSLAQLNINSNEYSACQIL